MSEDSDSDAETTSTEDTAKEESAKLLALNTTSGSQLLFTFLLVVVFTGANIAYYNHSMGLSLVDALYFFTVTISSVGYGEIFPVNQEQRAWMSVSILLGFIVNSVLAGILLNLLANSGKRERKKEKKEAAAKLEAAVLAYLLIHSLTHSLTSSLSHSPTRVY
jgi:voltage-gated potassium channel Kch